MFGKLLKGLFSGGQSSEPKTETVATVVHEGFEIIAEPRQMGGQWQVAGRIEKEIDGDRKVHVFIRADTLPSANEAADHMIRKAKIMIDQQGSAIF